MKTFLLICFLVLASLLLGLGLGSLYNSIFSRSGSPVKEKLMDRITKAFGSGSIALLLVSSASGLICRALNKDLATACKIYALVLIIALSVCYFFLIISKFRKILSGPVKVPEIDFDIEKAARSMDKKAVILTVSGILISVCALILSGTSKRYLQYDQTIETVNSILASGKFGSINPLTGSEYITPAPTRLSLLVLPYFYSILCHTFEVTPLALCCHIMPVFWLFCGMCCFWQLGKTLYKDSDKKKARLFYCICIFLLLCSNTAIGYAGFEAFHIGYTGGSILVLLLSVWVLDKALSEKYVACMLAIITEPFVISNQLMLGACLVITIGILVLTPAAKKYTERRAKA